MHEHDLGLSHDLPTLMERRRLLTFIGGAGAAAALAACTSGNSSPGGESQTEVAGGEIPEETAGPFPGDGSNGSTSSPKAASCAATLPRASEPGPQSPQVCR